MLQSFTSLMRNSYSGLSREVWLLALLTLINRTGSMVVLFMTIYLTTELHFTMTQAGVAMSCFGAGSLLGAWLGGFLTDKMGYYRTIFWTLLLAGIFFFALMQMKTFLSFCLMVFVVSSIADGFRPAMMASISAYAKKENYNRSLSLIRLAINLGFAAGAAVTGFIALHFGYRWLFIIDGLTCILAAFFLLWALEPKEEVLSKEEAKIISEDGIGSSAYADHRYLLFVFFQMLSAIVFMQLFSTVPVFMKDNLLFSEAEYGVVMMVNGLIIVLVEMPLVYILEKHFERMTLVVLGYALIVSGFASLMVAEASVHMIMSYFIIAISIGEVVCFPFSNSFALSRSTPGRRGQYMGLYSMGFSTAFIIAPSLGLHIAEVYGFEMLWLGMGILGMIALLGFVWIRQTEKKPAEKTTGFGLVNKE